MPDYDDGGFFRNETRSDYVPPSPYPGWCEKNPELTVEEAGQGNDNVLCDCPACTAYREFLVDAAESEADERQFEAEREASHEKARENCRHGYYGD